MSRLKKIKLGITLGDPAGIGPQILTDALDKIGNLRNIEITVIGDRWALDKFDFSRKKISFVDLKNLRPVSFSPGKLSTECGRLSIEYLKKAVELIKDKKVDCLVTLPINKEAVNKAGLFWLGHTEYLADAFGTKDVLMLLLNRFLKVSLVSRHVAIKDVTKELTKERVFKTIVLTQQGLKKYFNIKDPKIGVCALNPHASDGGMFGEEEKRIIIPAIEEVKTTLKEIDISGPFPPDTLFLKAKRRCFDVVVAMYHDQALIALKLTDSLRGVNLTLGLPFVRTSPLHGTALDIAGKKRASSASLLEAIKIALFCTAHLKNKFLF